MFGLKTPHYYLQGMNHESKSPSLGMISTATRTTATVSPLSPLTNGNAVAQSSNSGFAAALRKLAKQAEDPRGSSLSGESSPVSSPATSHSSPVTTPKRASIGPLLGQNRGHGVPSTAPVVTIAPTKTSNGLWRAEARQAESGVRGISRERVSAEATQTQQDKGVPPIPSSPHPLAHPFGLTPSTVMQDPRIQSLSLPGQVQVHPSGAVPEEYLRGLRHFATSDDLRLTSLPLGLDHATAAHAAAAAYYHPAYLHYPLTLQRMEESLCLSALRSQFYSVPAGGAFPPLHPSALHMHLPGARYPGELNHTALAERLQMENDLRQREREREREREKEREREAELEREREREREREEERERERERELDRQKERQRERRQQMARVVEGRYLAEMASLRAPQDERARPGGRLTPQDERARPGGRLTPQDERARPGGRLTPQDERARPGGRLTPQDERARPGGRLTPQDDRARPGGRLTPSRPDKLKEPDHPGLPAPKPLSLQPGLHPSMSSIPHPMPSLVPSHMGKHHTAAPGGIHGALAAAMMTQRANDEDRWLARQRRQGQEREGLPEMGLRSPGKGAEPRRDGHRTNSVHHNPGNRDVPPRLGAPPPLISPKAPPHTPAPPTTLWNPASLVDTPTDPRRKFNPPTPPSRPPPGLTRTDRPLSWGERLEEGGRRRGDGPERYPYMRGAGIQEPALWNRAEQEKPTHSLHQHHHHHHHLNNLHQRSSVPVSTPSSTSELVGQRLATSPSPSRERRQGQAPDNMQVYDEVLQQHRRLLSKLDLEEKRRREAREGGYFYDLDESYDESDEEEVKAHLRRVTEQPPLKLDTSSEKVDFLRVCGLTTLAHRDQLLEKKRRKRRRMLRERSLSPPAVRGKRKAASPQTPPPPLTTPFTAEQMDNSPGIEDKKDFLQLFSLSHVTPQQRRDKERTEEVLRAIQRKAVTLDTIRYKPLPPCSSPPPSSTGDCSSAPPPCKPNGQHYPDSPSPSPPYSHHPNHHTDLSKPPVDSPAPHLPPPLAPQPERTGFMEGQSTKKLQGHQNGIVPLAQRKEPGPGQNGRSRPWERFTPEAFAQHFHQAVLQSTHNTLQKNKGVSNCANETTLKSDHSLPHNISPLKRPHPHHAPQHSHVNGRHFHPPLPHRDAPGPRDQLSEEEEEESGQEEEEEEMEDAPRRWQGIESVFEAYQEYMDEWSIERQVLHSQCKRLETQNYTLTRTAEQLSLSMGELVSQRQKVREERERLQAQLEHFRRCLTLPNMHWGRGQVNGHTPR